MGDLCRGLDRTVGVHSQHIHRACVIGTRIVVVRPDDQIDHAIRVNVPDRGPGPAKLIPIRERGAAIRPASDQRDAAGLDRPGGGLRNFDRVVFDLAITGSPRRVSRCDVRAQPEPGESPASKAAQQRGERQREHSIVRAVGNSDAGPFGGVVEDAVVVRIDPAIERRRRASGIGSAECDRRLRAGGQQKVGQRTHDAVFVVTRRDVVAGGGGVLRGIRFDIDQCPEPQPRHDRVPWPAVRQQRLIILAAGPGSRIRGISKILSQHRTQFKWL